MEWDFEYCEIELNENNATVVLRLTDEHDAHPDNSNYSRNVKLIKTEDGWKGCGGTLFQGNLYVDLECYDSRYDRYYMSIYSFSPSTGENTILYLAIAVASLADMTALVVRRKRIVE